MGSGKGSPAPPNFTQAATPTQNTPWATSSWTQGPSTPGVGTHQIPDPNGFPGQTIDAPNDPTPGPMVQNVGLNPSLDQANQSMMGQLGSAWGKPLDNGDSARTAASNSLYGQATSRLDPQWQQAQQGFNSQMAAQGLMPGTEAYNNAYGNMARAKNDAYNQADFSAISGGTQAAQQQQQLDMNSRAAPIAGMAGLQGLAGMPQNPLLSAAMAQYQGALQNYGIQQQGKNSTMGGLLGTGGTLGAAGIMA